MLAAKAVLFLAFSCAFAEPRLERRFGPELKPHGAPIGCESAGHGGSAVAVMVNRLRGGGIFGGKVGGRFGGTVVGSTVMAPKAGTADLGTVAETKEINVIKTAPNQEESKDGGAAAEDGSKTATPSSKVPTAGNIGTDSGAGGHEVQPPRPKKYIYIISDSTGFTASHALTSCVAQYDGLSVDEEGAPDARVELQTQMFSNVYTWNKIEKIIQLASRMKAMVVYSLVSKDLCRFSHNHPPVLHILHIHPLFSPRLSILPSSFNSSSLPPAILGGLCDGLTSLHTPKSLGAIPCLGASIPCLGASIPYLALPAAAFSLTLVSIPVGTPLPSSFA
jgi:hypothetical protein